MHAHPVLPDGVRDSLRRMLEMERAERSAIEDADQAIRRFHRSITLANDAVVHRWFVFAGNVERFPDRLNLLEQAAVEYTILWAKKCIVDTQLILLFALGSFTPSLGMVDRRRWCRNTLDSLCLLCGARSRNQ